MTTVERPPTERPLWRQPDFRRLWFGETTSQLGSRISGVAIALVAITTLHASILHLGLLTAASWLPWLLIGLPAGAWVDRLPRRPLMLAANLASMLLLLSIPLAAALGGLTIGQLLITALLTGTANVVSFTAFQVYLPAVVSRDDLPSANARLQGAGSAADVAGPGLAGLIAQALGPLGGLFADAASFAVATVCLLRVRAREVRIFQAPAVAGVRGAIRREIAGGLRFVARDRYLRVFAVFGAASNLALTGYQAILVVFLVRTVGVTAGTLGLLLTAMSMGGVIGALAATPIARRFGTAHGTLISLLATSPSALLIPLTGTGWRLGFVVAGGVLVGAGVVAGNVIKGSFRQAYTPGPLLGRVTVSMQFLNFGTIPLGGLLGGALGQAIGVRPTLWAMTAAVALAPLILLIGPIRRRRDLPTAPPADPDQVPPTETVVVPIDPKMPTDAAVPSTEDG
jgi:MFS family permease